MSGNAQGSGASVLLVSGRPAFWDPLSQAFSAAGITVIVARDALVAAAAFRGDHLPPAGAIIDLLTIGEDAADVCNRLRDAPAAASIPILFIGTGAESVRSTTDALIAGGDGFFQLPVEASRVTAKIAAYVGAPVPNLPQGLLVTIDEHDILERTPEPARVIVPPAALPGDLLGDDDDDDDDGRNHFGSSDPFGRSFGADGSGDVGHDLGDRPDPGHDLGDTPPGGLPRPPASDEFSTDFADTTSPMTKRTAVTARGGAFMAAPVPSDVDHDTAPTALTAVPKALRRLAEAATAPVNDAVADRDDDGAHVEHDIIAAQRAHEAEQLEAVVRAAHAEEEAALQDARRRRAEAEARLVALAVVAGDREGRARQRWLQRRDGRPMLEADEAALAAEVDDHGVGPHPRHQPGPRCRGEHLSDGQDHGEGPRRLEARALVDGGVHDPPQRRSGDALADHEPHVATAELVDDHGHRRMIELPPRR